MRFLSFTSTVALLLRCASAATTDTTVFVIAKDDATARSGTSGLRAYGIPYATHITTTATTKLPALNSSLTQGNYGGIILIEDILPYSQLQKIWDYQKTFGVRFVRLNIQPSADTGTAFAIASAGCCDAGVEQLLYFTNTSAFQSASLKTGSAAGVSTTGLFHTPAKIVNSSIAWEIASFAPSGQFKDKTTAAVVNLIDGRQQMSWFMPFDTSWSIASNFVQHAWIAYVTRGLYGGMRRINLNTQVDDVFLTTELFKPKGATFRLRPADLKEHVSWMKTINAKMPAGSKYFIELGHNGNGNIEATDPDYLDANHEQICLPGAIDVPEQPDETAATLEYKKPLGTGVDLWPKTPTTYPFSLACTQWDDLEVWFADSTNLNSFAHVSHTFTHEDLNNATYSDASKEIAFNKAWMSQTGIAGAKMYSGKGLIPPAITGLHNGDAIRAWVDNGITGVVGDNTRGPLLNTQNEYWPLMTTTAANGYAGLPIVPRWATLIYYNCDKIDCDLSLYKNVSNPSGTWDGMLVDSRETNTRYLLQLRQDPFMFHQANMRQTDVDTTKVNGVSKRWSLLQTWVETVVAEFTRLVDWPIISLKHDDVVKAFIDRMVRDQCLPSVKYNIGPSITGAQSLLGVTVTANNIYCSSKIPVTFPGAIRSAGTATKEQIGNDPLTLWVQLTGSAQTFELQSPIPL